jgi:hypothetical protein
MRTNVAHLVSMAALSAGLLALPGEPVQSQPVKGGQQVQNFDPNGQPKGFKEGDSKRIAVWHGKKGWHIRTTTAKTLHHFTGKIVVEGGVFEGVEPHHLEDKGRFADWWKLTAKDHEIVIDFKTDRGIDGINFQLSKDAKLIRFNLHIDGKHHKDLIFIGGGGIHPDHDPFVLVAHPGVK